MTVETRPALRPATCQHSDAFPLRRSVVGGAFLHLNCRSLVYVGLALAFLGQPLAAQDDPSSEAAEVEAEPSQEKTTHRGFELFPDEAPNVSDSELREQGADPCALNEEGNWIDWLNRKVTKSVCGSARWFDSFFGTQREFEDRDSTFGRLGVGAFWDEDDGVDAEFRFRAKINLPNLDDRWQASFGRGSADEVLDGGGAISPGDDYFDDETEWLIGFGYHFTVGNRSRLAPSIGASWSSGLDPYVRVRYTYQVPWGERRQFRLRLIPQWQESKGYGYSVRATIDRTIAEKLLSRWEFTVKDFEERFVGFRYAAFVNLFHKLSPKNALWYRLGLLSESNLPHEPQDIGLLIRWRTTVYKEILVVESLVGTTFRQRPQERSRDPELLLGLLLELKFGQ